MSDKAAAAKVRHRNTVFPRSEPSARRVAKPVFAELGGSREGQKLRRMIPVNPPSLLSTAARTPATAVRLRKDEMNPWDRYQPYMKLQQAGPTTAAYLKDGTFDEMAVKEIKDTDKKLLSQVKVTDHKNIVRLHEALYHEGSIYFFYEVMDVSLAQVFGTPLGGLLHFEVAAFCKEILEGLDYIHTNLHTAHGDLSSSNVLLCPGTAAVKIANIGTSMLEQAKDTQNDIRSLGAMITECLEPHTALRDKNSLVGDKWDPVLREFQSLTVSKTAAELLKHDFLMRSPGPACLRHYIRAARESAPKNVEILPEWAKN